MRVGVGELVNVLVGVAVRVGVEVTVGVGDGVGDEARRGTDIQRPIQVQVPSVEIFGDVKPLARMKYMPGVAILKQKASAGGRGKPASSVLSTLIRTVEPSGAITSMTMSVPVILRSRNPVGR